MAFLPEHPASLPTRLPGVLVEGVDEGKETAGPRWLERRKRMQRRLMAVVLVMLRVVVAVVGGSRWLDKRGNRDAQLTFPALVYSTTATATPIYALHTYPASTWGMGVMYSSLVCEYRVDLGLNAPGVLFDDHLAEHAPFL